MFACFSCNFQTDQVSDFTEHLQKSHAHPVLKQESDSEQPLVKTEILPSTSYTAPELTVEATETPVTEPYSKPSVQIKKEARTVEGDDDEDYFQSSFEPIIQIQVATEEERKECASILRDTTLMANGKHYRKGPTDYLELPEDDFAPKKRKVKRRKKIKTNEEGEEEGEPKKRAPKKKKEVDPNAPPKVYKKRGPKFKPEHLKKRRVYPCNQCIREFKNNCDLQRHITSTHLKLKPYKCDQCDAAFALMGNLKKHIGYVHLNIKRVPKKVTCQICGKTYNSNYHLTIHISSVHTMEKRYQCEYCGMKFAWKKCYERHISSVHLGEKNFRCEVCGTSFARKEHLKTHQKRHTREANAATAAAVPVGGPAPGPIAMRTSAS